MVTPTKLWGKKDVKWTFLSNPNSPVLHQEFMQLKPEVCLVLQDHLQELPTDATNSPVVPVAIVAGFDSYRKPDHAKDFQWAHDQAQKINTKLEQQADKITDAEQAYTVYCETTLSKIVHAPTYKGRRRVKFENLCEKTLYETCYTLKDQEEQILHSKSRLCARLYFYSVSLHKGESIESVKTLLLSIPRQFRERWGTENNFKGVKHRFYLMSNDRTPTARHARWIVGNLLDNAWHFARFYYKSLNSSPHDGSTPFMKGMLPEIRDSSDTEFPPELTAQGYLLSNLRDTLNKCLKKSFPTLILC
jgi:hypothetical protein